MPAVIVCARCQERCTQYQAIGAGARWCESCVGQHATLGEFLAALQARGICIQQKAPGEYAVAKEMRAFPGLVQALTRHRVALKACLVQGITAKYGPLLEWAPCIGCGQPVYVGQDGELAQHQNASGTGWCVPRAPVEVPA